MLWFRALIFTVLVPGSIAVLIPQQFIGSQPLRSGWSVMGWLLAIAGGSIYFLCLLTFLAAQGTPAIFFTRPLSLLLGEEPSVLVRRGLYRWARNPMYVGVLAVIFGQAIAFRSPKVYLYGVLVFACFHLVVVFLEEPHLRARSPSSFDEYSRIVPRWLGFPGRSRKRGAATKL